MLTSGGFPSYEHLLEQLTDEGFSTADVVSALIHQLQSGEAAKPAPPAADYERPEREERAPRGDNRRERAPHRHQDERRPTYEDRRRQRSPQPGVAHKPEPKPMTPPPPPSQPVEKTVEKTYSDEEIRASVKNPEPKPESKLFIKAKPVPPAAKPKASRATPEGQTRLWVNLGEAQGIKPIDIVNAVAGETGLPGKVVGAVDVRQKHLFMDVADEHLNSILAKLNRTQIKGHKVKAKMA
jgi:ATP-dependent RNA helicase DeaD